MKLKNVAAAAALSATAALFAMPASATVWNTTGDSTTGPYGNTLSFTPAGAPTLTASAYSSATGGTSALATACLDAFGGGLGVVNRGEDASATVGSGGCDVDAPNHSVDSSGGVDGVLMSFAQAVKLTDVTIGWVGNNGTPGAVSDSDFSVLYFTGGSGPAMNYSSLANMLTNGWSLLKNVDGGASANVTYSLGNASTSAKYWYISAYSSSFGGTLDCYDDYFKISGVTGYKVPEPATLTLFGLGLAGIGFARRRRK